MNKQYIKEKLEIHQIPMAAPLPGIAISKLTDKFTIDYDKAARGIYARLAREGEHDRLVKGFIPTDELGLIRDALCSNIVIQQALAESKGQPDTVGVFMIREKDLQAEVDKHLDPLCKAILRCAVQAEETRKGVV